MSWKFGMSVMMFGRYQITIFVIAQNLADRFNVPDYFVLLITEVSKRTQEIVSLSREGCNEISIELSWNSWRSREFIGSLYKDFFLVVDFLEGCVDQCGHPLFILQSFTFGFQQSNSLPDSSKSSILYFRALLLSSNNVSPVWMQLKVNHSEGSIVYKTGKSSISHKEALWTRVIN
jgi:hypothetical protein